VPRLKKSSDTGRAIKDEMEIIFETKKTDVTDFFQKFGLRKNLVFGLAIRALE
jgi:hypothetical protein